MLLSLLKDYFIMFMISSCCREKLDHECKKQQIFSTCSNALISMYMMQIDLANLVSDSHSTMIVILCCLVRMIDFFSEFSVRYFLVPLLAHQSNQWINDSPEVVNWRDFYTTEGNLKVNHGVKMISFFVNPLLSMPFAR